jgi:hypothetical protein
MTSAEYSTRSPGSNGSPSRPDQMSQQPPYHQADLRTDGHRRLSCSPHEIGMRSRECAHRRRYGRGVDRRDSRRNWAPNWHFCAADGPVTFVLSAGGHIACMVNAQPVRRPVSGPLHRPRPAQVSSWPQPSRWRTWWPGHACWLAGRGGGRKRRRQAPGRGTGPVRCPARGNLCP